VIVNTFYTGNIVNVKLMYLMFMERDLYNKLLAWKKDIYRQPLLLQGARQVGKTFLLKEFGQRTYKQCCYINFEETPKCKEFFEADLKPHRIVRDLEIYFKIKIDSSTLIFFDEIQECPNALISLKYFCEHAPEYHVVAAGRLGVKLSQGFPVGKVHFLHLYPMNFLEFLSAIHRPTLRTMLEEIKTLEPIAEPHHQLLTELLKIYFYVGGMPKPVQRYIETGDFVSVRESQEDILKAYALGFYEHAPNVLVTRIKQIWNSIPLHLGKENKRFIFSAIKNGARLRDYEEALQWLIDAGLIYRVSSISEPRRPLINDADAFKIYLIDVGLLGAMCRVPAHLIIEGDQFFVEYKGSLTENYVVQELKAAYGSELFYWTSARDAKVEVLLEHDGEIFPLEVKSGTSTEKNSLLVYNKKYHPSLISRATLMNLKQEGKFCNYPLYLINRFPIAQSLLTQHP